MKDYFSITMTELPLPRRVVLLPLAGCLLFLLLYFIATLFYPGGSQQDAHAPGFSWMHNYWCNLLNEKAINGAVNTARPIAFAAMIVLCISLAAFWILFPVVTAMRQPARAIMQVSGTLAMAICAFIFTGYHDSVINAAGFFGLVAMAATFLQLFRVRWRKLFVFGLFNLALVALNNVLYYGPGNMYWLPLVQKLSFLSFICWICLIVYRMAGRAGDDY
jgi:hypothetical protein